MVLNGLVSSFVPILVTVLIDNSRPLEVKIDELHDKLEKINAQRESIFSSTSEFPVRFCNFIKHFSIYYLLFSNSLCLSENLDVHVVTNYLKKTNEHALKAFLSK